LRNNLTPGLLRLAERASRRRDDVTRRLPRIWLTRKLQIWRSHRADATILIVAPVSMD
jgi:hypothetical protein